MYNLFDFKEKNFFLAFLLPSFVTGLSAAIAIEYNYIMKLIKDKKQIKSVGRHLKHASQTFFVAFITSFFAYYLIHFLTGFGNSMLHTAAGDLPANV